MNYSEAVKRVQGMVSASAGTGTYQGDAEALAVLRRADPVMAAVDIEARLADLSMKKLVEALSRPAPASVSDGWIMKFVTSDFQTRYIMLEKLGIKIVDP